MSSLTAPRTKNLAFVQTLLLRSKFSTESKFFARSAVREDIRSIPRVKPNKTYGLLKKIKRLEMREYLNVFPSLWSEFSW